MKDKYILIAYKPETYISSGCGCCPGDTYDHDFELNQYDDLDALADKITEYAVKNTEESERISGYGIWIIYNGDFIIGSTYYEDGKDPCKKLFDIGNFDYGDNIEKEIVWEKILKSLDEKTDKNWREAELEKKEKERVRKEKAVKKKEEAKKQKQKEKEEREREKLKELADKYPEELK